MMTSQDDIIKKVRSVGAIPNIDLPYIIFLGSSALAIVSISCFMSFLAMCIIDSYFEWKTGYWAYGPEARGKLMVINLVFFVKIILLRIFENRLKEYASAVKIYELPKRISATLDDIVGGGKAKFKVSCTVKISIEGENNFIIINKYEKGVIRLMDRGFLAAIRDPIISYSKENIEQVLKEYAAIYFGDIVKKVEISDINHKRIPKTSK